MKHPLLLLGICSLVPVASLLGQTPAPAATPPPASQTLVTKMWFVGITKLTGVARDRLPEEVPTDQPLGDSREWLEYISASYSPEVSAVHFDAGEEALFDERLRILMVRAKAKTIEGVEAVLRRHQSLPGPVNNLRLQAELVEFSAAALAGSPEKLSFAALVKAAGDSWRVIDRQQFVIGHNGRGMAISRTPTSQSKPASQLPVSPSSVVAAGTPGAPAATVAPAEKVEEPALAAGEYGTAVGADAFLELDGGAIGVSLLYHSRSPEALGKPGWDWKVITSTHVVEGTPILVQFAPAPGESAADPKARQRGLVIRVDVDRLKNVVYHPEVDPNRQNELAPAK